jgi:hypothetical protein
MIYDIVLHTSRIDVDVNLSFKTFQNSSIMMLGEKGVFLLITPWLHVVLYFTSTIELYLFPKKLMWIIN